MTSTYKFMLIILLVSVLFAGFTSAPHTQAASYVAIQDGNWNDTATWGASVPTSADDVTIPPSIRVTIPSTLTVTRDAGTTLTLNGILGNSGGTFINNGTLTMIYVSGTLAFSNVDNGIVTNNGTINTSGSFTNNATFTNNGTINNPGTIFNEDNGVLHNYGSISNSGIIYNLGVIDLHCIGTMTGTAVNGNAPINRSITLPAPTLVSPEHRAHSPYTNPSFGWTSVNKAQSYRLMVYTEDRTFEFKKRTFDTTYTLNTSEALTSGTKYLWRTRTQNSCNNWSVWSARYTLFID
jgi:hypothetical protein